MVAVSTLDLHPQAFQFPALPLTALYYIHVSDRTHLTGTVKGLSAIMNVKDSVQQELDKYSL